MTRALIQIAAAVFLFSATPSALERLERPSPRSGAEAPAPETPLPARAIEHHYDVGPLRLDVVAGTTSARRGEWSDALQPEMFRVYLSRARGPGA